MPSKYAFRSAIFEHFFSRPEEHYVEPFRIYGNLWFVGNENVGSYLMDTGEGLILIDTGFPTTRDLMIQSIWEAGFNPRDIRYIFHTHGHFDHFGTTNFLVHLSGAKTCLGAGDAKMFRERPELALVKDAHYSKVPLFVPDIELEDGQVITLGNTSVRCVSVPGHTMGVMAYFIELTENGETQLAGLYGGVGLNTLCRDFVLEYGVPEHRACYVNSLEKVRYEPVTITLGNHTAQNNTLGKRQQMLDNPEGPNPFIDPAEWQRAIDQNIERYHTMLAEEELGTDQI